MTVYTGTLRELSSGFVSREKRGTHLMFVDIGKTRINNVIMAPYFSAMMDSAIGEEVAMSVTGPAAGSTKPHQVVALRTRSGGAFKLPVGVLIVSSIITWFKFWLTAIVGGAFLTFIAVFVLGNLFPGWAPIGIGAAIGVLFILYFLLKPFQLIFSVFKCRAARLTLGEETYEGISAPDSA